MKKTATIRNVVLGKGMPKICVPVTSSNDDDIAGQMEKISRKYRDIADIIEFRVDYYDGVFEENRLLPLLKRVRGIIGDMALLVTFRTKGEGGERDISPEKYYDLIRLIIDSGEADAVDIEAFFDDKALKMLSKTAREKNVAVIASNHDFNATPDSAEILRRLKLMEENGADAAKIAVMPNKKSDVLTLINALYEASEELNVPVIAISMGRLGAVSRLAGEVFGSCLTFGTAGSTSAPGQIEAGELKNILRIMNIGQN